MQEENKEENKNDKCLICERIGLIKQGRNPYFIKEFETGYAVLGDYQYFKGYCLFLCKEHKTELHQLDKEFRAKFLWEMSLLAEAVYKTFKPDKLNYELLGNTEAHMHWHIFPRYKATDPVPDHPVWVVGDALLDSKKPTPQEREELIEAIRKNL